MLGIIGINDFSVFFGNPKILIFLSVPFLVFQWVTNVSFIYLVFFFFAKLVSSLKKAQKKQQGELSFVS